MKLFPRMNSSRLVVRIFTHSFARTNPKFILVEEGIIHDTQQTEKAIADLNPSVIVDSTSNIIRRANRVLLVTYQEMENSEDAIFTAQLEQVSKILKESKNVLIPLELNFIVHSRSIFTNDCNS